MPDFVAQGVLSASLEIELLSSSEALVHINAELIPPPHEHFQLQIQLWGSDDGEDDYLYFFMGGLPGVQGDRLQQAGVSFTIARHQLDEDNGRGAIRRARRRRETDEVYAQVQLFARPTPTSALAPYGGSITTNTVRERF